MWCCASKPVTKKPLRSAIQQPLPTATLTLPPTIRLQYKQRWQGKLLPATHPPTTHIPPPSLPTSPQVQQLRKKIQQLQGQQKSLQESFKSQKAKGKQLEEGLQKSEAVATVLEYLILKQEQVVEGFVGRIRAG